MATLDMNNRDPQNLNNYVQVDFDDVLAEPQGAHSADCVWKNSYKCFNCGRNFCYKLLTFLCGICIALYWGCTFACLAFEAIWLWTPSIRALHIALHPIKKIYSITLGGENHCFSYARNNNNSEKLNPLLFLLLAFLAPLMETLGLFFSRIHVTNSTGEPPKPLDGLGESGHAAPVKNFR